MKKKSIIIPLAVTSMILVNAISAFAFNPQPEPPGDRTMKFVNPGVIRGFNPQPEPPGDRTMKFVNLDVICGLNPQPEPPGDKNLIINVIKASVIR